MTSKQNPGKRSRRRPVVAAAVAVGCVLFLTGAAPPDDAVPSLEQIVMNLYGWLVGIVAAVATLFLAVGGLRYMLAGGDPGETERAKAALKSAGIGYCLVLLAPAILKVLKSVVT